MQVTADVFDGFARLELVEGIVDAVLDLLFREVADPAADGRLVHVLFDLDVKAAHHRILFMVDGFGAKLKYLDVGLRLVARVAHDDEADFVDFAPFLDGFELEAEVGVQHQVILGLFEDLLVEAAVQRVVVFDDSLALLVAEDFPGADDFLQLAEFERPVTDFLVLLQQLIDADGIAAGEVKDVLYVVNGEARFQLQDVGLHLRVESYLDVVRVCALDLGGGTDDKVGPRFVLQAGFIFVEDGHFLLKQGVGTVAQQLVGSLVLIEAEFLDDVAQVDAVGLEVFVGHPHHSDHLGEDAGLPHVELVAGFYQRVGLAHHQAHGGNGRSHKYQYSQI